MHDNEPFAEASAAMQPSDLKVAQNEIAQSPLIQIVGRSPSAVQATVKMRSRQDWTLQSIILARPDVWALVQKVATACLANGGSSRSSRLSSFSSRSLAAVALSVVMLQHEA